MPPPTMKAEIAVPITAKSVMEPMFWKKFPWVFKHTQIHSARLFRVGSWYFKLHAVI